MKYNCACIVLILENRVPKLALHELGQSRREMTSRNIVAAELYSCFISLCQKDL